MNRERLGAILLRAYPADARAAHGPEMLGTLLDASAGSILRFLREAVDLVRLGLRARATQITAAGARSLLADGACLAGVFFLAQDLATGLSGRGVSDPVYPPASMAVLGVLLGVAMLGHDRLAGAGALAWLALRVAGALGGFDLASSSSAVLPVICFAVMVVRPRHHGPAPLRSALGASWWLVLLVVLAGAFGGAFAMLAFAAAAAFGLSAAALVTTDPRPAIAVAMVAADVAIAKAGSGQPAPITLAFLVAVPVVVVLTIGRTRQLAAAGE